jgi:hypothetical protein
MRARAPRRVGSGPRRIEGDAVPTRTTPLDGRRASSPRLVAGLLFVLLGAGVVAAAPARAIDDPTRPDARVIRAPSCHPGGLAVEVTAGDAPYSVRLATTRTPAGEDEAVLQPRRTVVLKTGDVDWGETIDGRLEYTALDGSGISYVNELEEYSFTRPTEEDCAAIAPAPLPAAPATPPPSAPTSGPAVEVAPEAGGAPPVRPAGDVAAPAAGRGDGAPAGAAVEGGARGEGGAAVPGSAQLSAQLAPTAVRRGVTSWPMFCAALALLGSATGLVLVGVRRWASVRRRVGIG